MEEKYINFILKKCIYSKSKSLFISYYKDNESFIRKLIYKAKEIGYEDILIEENDINKEYRLLNELSEEEIKKHPYFNNPIWNDAIEKEASFLLVSTKYPNYFDSIPKSKLIKAAEARSLARKKYIERVSDDTISWTIFGLPNTYWAKYLFPNEENSYKKLENLIYSFCMLDSFENYIDIENKKISFLNHLKIKELKFSSNLGTDLKIGLVDNYIFRSLEKNHCIENFPTYSIWTMPNKYKANGIVYGSIPISIENYLISDYWFLFKDGIVVDYDASNGKEYLDAFFKKDNHHKRLGEIAIIDSDSPIAKTKKIYHCNLFDENISTHLAFGMAYKNTIKDGSLMTDEQLDQFGCNICSEHMDFTIGTDSLSIIAITQDNKEIEIYSKGNFNYELINEKSPFSKKLY